MAFSNAISIEKYATKRLGELNCFVPISLDTLCLHQALVGAKNALRRTTYCRGEAPRTQETARKSFLQVSLQPTRFTFARRAVLAVQIVRSEFQFPSSRQFARDRSLPTGSRYRPC